MKSRHAAAFMRSKAELEARRTCLREGHVWARKPRPMARGLIWVKSCRRCPAAVMMSSEWKRRKGLA